MILDVLTELFLLRGDLLVQAAKNRFLPSYMDIAQ